MNTRSKNFIQGEILIIFQIVMFEPGKKMLRKVNAEGGVQWLSGNFQSKGMR
jgi:hypothetical protein